MNLEEIERALEAILFAAGEPVETKRLCAVIECEREDLDEAARRLMDRLSYDRRGIRVIRLADSYQMCSSGEMGELVAKALETRKPPRLSASQLETLSVIAYYQPVTKAAVEQLRGVDSSYTVTALLNKKLIEECGRLNVPGRPILYRTTDGFLRTFGLEQLSDMPELELADISAPQDVLKSADSVSQETTEEGQNV